jgi:2',3'-cyclic-nucleotide 2'-phosphodiesterase (5'-nucleotidase family)
MTPLTHRPSLGPILNDFDFGLQKTLEATKARLLAKLSATLAPFNRPGAQAIVLAHLGAAARAYAGLKGQLQLDLENAPTGPDLTEALGATLVVDGHSHEVVEPCRPRGRGLYLNLGQGGEALALITLYKDAPLRLELIPYEDLAALDPEPGLASQIENLGDRLGLNETLLTLPPGSPYGLEGLWETVVPLGQLVVEAMALAANSQLAFLNKGALRTGLAGEVTVGSLREALPFNDLLFRASLSGRELMALLVKFGRKGFRGFPLIHGLTLWAYQEGDQVALAGASLYGGEGINEAKNYSLAISGQMARLLPNLAPGLTPQGTILDAVLALIRQRASLAFLHDPSLNHYAFFEDRAAAEKAFRERQA